jgi:signal transduction histidine kinase
MRVRSREPVLVLTPTGRDAEMIREALARGEIPTFTCPDMPALCDCVAAGAGALLIAEEAFDAASFALLVETLEAQEPWSDLPIVVLAGSAFADSGERAERLLAPLRNVMVLERPVRVPVLATALRVALRARRRQHELRQYLHAREVLARERAAMLASEQEARHEAEAANRLKDEFLATVSHELRTPVNVILGWSGMLARDDTDTAMRRRAIDVIHRNARAQAHVIDELLDVSRIITGKLRMEVGPVYLVPIVQDVVEALRPAVEAKRLALRMESPPELPPIVGDADRLRQVIWNLLANAVKFTPEGGAVVVTLEKVDGYAEVRVADTGIGIDAAVLPFVFDRFRQADSTTTRAHGGLGLGLAIVRQLVELHGGSVSASSDGVGRGAAFVVRLPLTRRTAVPAEPPRRAPLAEGTPDGLPDLAGIRLLVVDDDADGREMVAELLRRQGAIVECGANGAETLAALRTFQPEAILLDIAMPGMDGFELLSRIREHWPHDPPPPVLALTAYARTEDRARALAAGFAAHVAKPIDALRLIETVRDLLAG